jgi:hypothetical protein
MAAIVLATAGCASGPAEEVPRGVRGRRLPMADGGLIDEIDGVRFRVDLITKER